MTTYNQKTGVWTLEVAYTGVTYMEVEGEVELADAKRAAIMAAETNLGPVIENSKLTVGNWPMAPEVMARNTEIEGVHVL